jgi:hypothetical protein
MRSTFDEVRVRCPCAQLVPQWLTLVHIEGDEEPSVRLDLDVGFGEVLNVLQAHKAAR